jgi:hypothetical protein
MKLYERFYDILTKEQHELCTKELETPTWVPAGGSQNEPNSIVFWYKELIDNVFFNEVFLRRIEFLTKKKFVIDRLYANGQSHGQPGSLHIDSENEQSWTFLYYANPHWNINWGGSTIFYKNEKEYDQALFIPNTGIIFKSNILHAGLEPTKSFNYVRMTVAFKLTEILRD